VRQRRKETYKQELQVLQRARIWLAGGGPVSAQALVDWRLGECGDKFTEVYTEANSVMGAEAADF
jgi:hypothetical protein